jgi:hypothetical protein
MQANDSGGKRVATEILVYSCQVQGSLYEARRTRRDRPVLFSHPNAEITRMKKGYLEENAQLVKETTIVVDGVPGDDRAATFASS